MDAPVTVTLNPCVDVTLWRGENGDITRRELQSGGKGINVARVLANLGVRARAFAPCGGESGALCARLAREEGVALHALPIARATRTVTTEVDERTLAQRVTFEPGAPISEDEAARLLAAVDEALPRGGTLLVCGSAACDRAAELVPEMISLARARGAFALLDASGQALRQGLAARPSLVKPNLTELSGFLAREIAPGGESAAARELLAHADAVLLSLGERGALYIDNAINGAIKGAINGTTDGATDGAINGAINGATDRATDRAINSAINGAIKGAINEAINGTIDGATDRAIDGAINGAINGATDCAINGATDGAINDATDRATDGTINGTIKGAIDGATDGAINGAINGARELRVPARRVATVNAVGSGDCLVAGFIYGRCQGWPLEKCLALGSACGAANAAMFAAARIFWTHIFGTGYIA